MAYNKETDMWEGFIYKIWNDVNDKIYIGQTTQTIECRFKEHIYYSHLNNNNQNKHYIHKAIKKYGENHFFIQELVKLNNVNFNELKKDLNHFEQYYINKYNSSFNNYGYNLTKGGQNMCCLEKPVVKYSINGDYIDTYKSMSFAAQINGCSKKGISNCCRGKLKSTDGYVWRYLEDSFDKYNFDYKTNKGYFGCKKVNCYSLDDIFINTYDSIEIARKAVGLKNGYNITNVCKKKRNKAGGYHWYYADDLNQPDKTKIIIYKEGA